MSTSALPNASMKDKKDKPRSRIHTEGGDKVILPPPDRESTYYN